MAWTAFIYLLYFSWKERTGIQHGKIQELSDLEVPPDPELIKSGNLPDRKPFVISPNCGELSVGETGAGRRKGAPGVGVV